MDNRLKIAAVAVLVVITIVMVFFFFRSTVSFVPGTLVDQQTFKNQFQSTERIFIVMDVRGIKEDEVRTNVLQCGVDFAGSNGMGGKIVSYLSIGDDNVCVSPEGKASADSCFKNLNQGLTIYVHEGNQTAIYSNGLSVGVGRIYPTGACSIKRT